MWIPDSREQRQRQQCLELNFAKGQSSEVTCVVNSDECTCRVHRVNTDSLNPLTENRSEWLAVGLTIHKRVEVWNEWSHLSVPQTSGARIFLSDDVVKGRGGKLLETYPGVALVEGSCLKKLLKTNTIRRLNCERYITLKTFSRNHSTNIFQNINPVDTY